MPTIEFFCRSHLCRLSLHVPFTAGFAIKARASNDGACLAGQRRGPRFDCLGIEAPSAAANPENALKRRMECRMGFPFGTCRPINRSADGTDKLALVHGRLQLLHDLSGCRQKTLVRARVLPRPFGSPQSTLVRRLGPRGERPRDERPRDESCGPRLVLLRPWPYEEKLR